MNARTSTTQLLGQLMVHGAQYKSIDRKAEVASKPKRDRVFSDFKIIEEIPNSGRKIFRARKICLGSAEDAKAKKYQFVWYLKEHASEFALERELLFQEMLRFMAGDDQPKTRRVNDEKSQKTYLASKEIVNAVPLSQLSLDEIKKGDLNRLGELMYFSLIFQNADASIRNIYIDKKTSKFYLLDGEYAFYPLIDNSDKVMEHFNSTDVERFPAVLVFNPKYGWLDQVVSDPTKKPVTHKETKITPLCRFLHDNEDFQQGMLKANAKLISCWNLIDSLIEATSDKKYHSIFVKKIKTEIGMSMMGIQRSPYLASYVSQGKLAKDFKDFETRLNNFRLKHKKQLYADKQYVINMQCIQAMILAFYESEKIMHEAKKVDLPPDVEPLRRSLSM